MIRIFYTQHYNENRCLDKENETCNVAKLAPTVVMCSMTNHFTRNGYIKR